MIARLAAMVAIALTATPSFAASAGRADAALDRALQALVAMPGGPPGVIALVQRGDAVGVHTVGVADVAAPRAIEATDHMRVASVAKAFSGAIALALVQQGVLGLDDTIGQRRPDLPAAWHGATLRQLLNHTSGVPDFILSEAAQNAVRASPGTPLPPRALLDFVKDLPLSRPGRYNYSNSDNIIVGLIVETVTNGTYQEALAAQVTTPLGLPQTTLPSGTAMPLPFFHGYDIADDGAFEDVSELLAAGWAWASGGVVSTPADLNRFIRGYVGGALFGADVQREQRRFVRGGGSEPRGPGRNSAGLALFRYQTRCGTVYGHTGNTFGYTQFAAASSDGTRSVTVSMNLQRTQDDEGTANKVYRALRRTELLAVCTALAR